MVEARAFQPSPVGRNFHPDSTISTVPATISGCFGGSIVNVFFKNKNNDERTWVEQWRLEGKEGGGAFVCVGVEGSQCIVMDQKNHDGRADGEDETGCSRHRGKKRK